MKTRVRAGMTLMELVIGIAITGLMALAGAGAFASIIDHRKVIRESTVTTERAAALRDMLRTWISSGQVQIQQGGGPRGLTRTTIGMTSGQMTAQTIASRNPVVVAGAQAAGDELV